jgi:hypothetical protein
MRLYELVDSDQQVLSLIKPILLRAKAEGADSINMDQLLNDLDSEDNITAELMIDLLNRHRNDLKDIVLSATLDSIAINKNEPKLMTTKLDKNNEKMKKVATKQALDQLR